MRSVELGIIEQNKKMSSKILGDIFLPFEII